MRRLFLIMNPSSRSFRSRDAWPAIFSGLRKRGVFFDFALTEPDICPSHLAAAAISRGFDTIVAVGGDGTINDVINGLFPEDVRQGRARFGVLYTGTSPDFCQNLGLPLPPEPALDLLVSDRSRRVDTCRISCHATPGGAVTRRVFSCCANFGLGARVARGANAGLRKTFGDLGGTLLSLVSTMVTYQPPRFRLTIDGQRHDFPRTFNLFVGKGRLVASGIKLDVEIEPDDGRLYVIPLHGLSRGRLFTLLPGAYSGAITRRFPPLFGKQVLIESDEPAGEVEYDGDPRGYLPATIEVLPRSLELLCS